MVNNYTQMVLIFFERTYVKRMISQAVLLFTITEIIEVRTSTWTWNLKYRDYLV